jgi:hypothetical protein
MEKRGVKVQFLAILGVFKKYNFPQNEIRFAHFGDNPTLPKSGLGKQTLPSLRSGSGSHPSLRYGSSTAFRFGHNPSFDCVQGSGTGLGYFVTVRAQTPPSLRAGSGTFEPWATPTPFLESTASLSPLRDIRLCQPGNDISEGQVVKKPNSIPLSQL